MVSMAEGSLGHLWSDLWVWGPRSRVWGAGPGLRFCKERQGPLPDRALSYGQGLGGPQPPRDGSGEGPLGPPA